MTAFPDVLHSLSREAALRCAPDGTVRWADARASRHFGLAEGGRLYDAVVPGSEGKARRLLDDGAGGVVRDWELQLRDAQGEPQAVRFAAAPAGDGDVALLATLSPSDVSRQLDAMGETMEELSRLQRESTRQAREILAGRAEISRLGTDLDNAGRGIRALYDELAESADSLKLATESRGRLVADMGHELRAPLSSILGLAKLLASGIDGALTPEQERQVSFIRRSAEEMLELVNDLLDLSRIDAGKLRLRPAPFTVDALFALLRGQLRPLAPEGTVELRFEDETGGRVIESDEGKIAQVLRNFATNALKFTERGEVVVRAALDGDELRLEVRDTGIGIAPQDMPLVWDEFTQLDTPLHRKHKGSGLGLALVRKLAAVLGGEAGLESAPGVGTTASLVVPALHPDVAQLTAMRERGARLSPDEAPVLVLEDDPQEMFIYERYLAGSGFRVIPARSVAEAREAVRHVTPAAIVLDVMLDGETSWQFLEELKRDPRTCDVPTLVVTVLDRERKARALGASEFFVKPVEQQWLLRKLQSLAAQRAERPVRTVLVIDDDDVSRYLVRRLLEESPYRVLEAADGPEGVQAAREHHPDVIILDFVLGSCTAFDVLDQLKLEPDTRGIPVIVSTSRQLEEAERQRLANEATALMSKERLSREVALTRIRDALQHAVAAHAAPGASGNGNGNGNGNGARGAAAEAETAAR
ncbi:hybrid sensor histidine kinase/response regulator [Roseisolibacter sp. H3M3-2]|uniref:hybrid sensor histidine kinase/response regulator n=1 Tax=Roseisolibacter sp. H3M3-2 TaxID=3031323 RepID=UPI0023DC913C|nr:hybrid sensor histidine kinase/response regulator [Roseisolibacter sp. H3M3-2]MDF1504459.1 hybrid sensor histidine kinase/response regulator [Roseisolibacter sp. H3M3-2]